jgi:regulator of protease activity HflC (stomatin/prohibitin superfamily)
VTAPSDSGSAKPTRVDLDALAASAAAAATPRRMLVAGLLAIAVILAQGLVLVVQPGQVAVEVFLGSVADRVRAEGVYLVNPLASYPRMTVRRRIIEMSSGGGAAEATGGQEIMALSREQLPLAIDIGFPFAMLPAAAPEVYRRIGPGDSFLDQLIRPAARSAVRDAVARFGWQEAAVTRREELGEAIGARFAAVIARDLRELGFGEEEAGRVLALPPVQLRRVAPPQALQDAISEKLRATQDLERQTTLSQIARIEAERRENEGLGIARLFAQLPSQFTPEQIAVLLNAIADKTRADAVMRAVESQRVTTLVLEGASPAIQAGRP